MTPEYPTHPQAHAQPPSPTSPAPPAPEAMHPPTVPPPAGPPVTAGPRVGTIVWGLVLLILGVVVMSVALFGDFLDAQLALIAVLTIAGIGLLVGAVLQLRRG